MYQDCVKNLSYSKTCHHLKDVLVLYIYHYNNIYTDTRIENSHDEDRGISITGSFKDGNQYKELHEDTVISFPFYEITFDILL